MVQLRFWSDTAQSNFIDAMMDEGQEWPQITDYGVDLEDERAIELALEHGATEA